MRILVIALIAMLLNGCVTMPSQTELATADYGSPITQADAQAQAEKFMASILKDPYSTKYEWLPVDRGWHKDPPIMGGRAYYGWRLRGTLNSKNSYGAYVGTKPVEFVFHNGTMIAGYMQKELGYGDVLIMDKIF